jgi:hypothetical protein
MDLLRKLRRWSAACVLMTARIASPNALPAQPMVNEYEVKAAFLYKFASFVEWPGDVHTLPIVICVVGRDPFGDGLERAVSGKTVNGRPFTVRRLRGADPVQGCAILFVSASERGKLSAILGKLATEGILTVGDVPEFCGHGGMVNFDLASGKVELQVNLNSTEKAGLQLSSKLLSLARIVRTAGQ